LAAEGGSLRLTVANPKALATLRGAKLAAALREALRLEWTSKTSIPVALVVVKVVDGEVVESFMSNAFNLSAKLAKDPGAMFAQSKIISSSTVLTGQAMTSGELVYPEGDAKAFAGKIALSTIKKHKATNGFFFAVVTSQAKDRKSFRSDGTVLVAKKPDK